MEITREEFTRQYYSKTTKQMAIDLGVSRTTIATIAKSLGLKLKHGGRTFALKIKQ